MADQATRLAAGVARRQDRRRARRLHGRRARGRGGAGRAAPAAGHSGGDLAIRWNCKAGKCGSCSAEINGRPKLLCMTRLSALPQGPITITPLRTFPVIRDLVTDVSFNYDWALQVPSFAPPEGLRPGEYRMAQADVDRSQEFRKCIECWLCQDVCHVIRDHEDNKPAYAGPRYFIRHAELDMHPLDTGDRRGGCGSGRAWACATSPSAAPRSARPGSRSPTMRSSR